MPGGRVRSARVMRKLYGKVLQNMGKKGLHLTPGTTPKALVAQIVARSPHAEEDAARIVSLYERVVFGGQSLSGDDKREAQRAYVRLKRVARGWRKAA